VVSLTLSASTLGLPLGVWLLGWSLFLGWLLLGLCQDMLGFWAVLVRMVDPLDIYPGIISMLAMCRFPVKP
jgi:hypothetical protein